MMDDLTGRVVNIMGASETRTGITVADYTIAASCGIEFAPNADMCVAIDGVLPDRATDAAKAAFAAYTGALIVGVPCARGTYRHMPHERVSVPGRGVIEMRNNGIAAIRIAAELGAKRIILSRFTLEKYDAMNADCGYAGVTVAALDAIRKELAAKGVSIEFATPIVPPIASIPPLKASKTK